MENLILLLKAVLISIVEGITEFIPVSSTGHMILVGSLIDFQGKFESLFMIVIQLGAILAIVALYWNKIWIAIVGLFTGKKESVRFFLAILVGFLPAAVLGFLFDDFIGAKLFNYTTVALALIVGAILMIFIENKYRDKAVTREVEGITYKQALFIGFFQCFAMWPGMSRSASTIMGGWLAGLSTVTATEFSFFLAIPTMIGASTLKLVKGAMELSGGELFTLAVGFIVAFLVALIVVDKFISFLKNKPMKIFAVYRMIVGVIIISLVAINML